MKASFEVVRLMYKAYEELSAPLPDLCEGLTALHDADPHGKPESMTVHPAQVRPGSAGASSRHDRQLNRFLGRRERNLESNRKPAVE